jgi:hypothetical protein
MSNSAQPDLAVEVENQMLRKLLTEREHTRSSVISAGATHPFGGTPRYGVEEPSSMPQAKRMVQKPVHEQETSRVVADSSVREQLFNRPAAIENPSFFGSEPVSNFSLGSFNAPMKRKYEQEDADQPAKRFQSSHASTPAPTSANSVLPATSKMAQLVSKYQVSVSAGYEKIPTSDYDDPI